MKALCLSICFLLTALQAAEPNAALLICQRQTSADTLITSYGTVTEIDGKLVTAWHVVKEGGEIKIAANNGWIVATVARHDEFLDLALLKTKQKAKLSRPVAEKAVTRTPVAIAAPGGNLQVFAVKLTGNSNADDIGGEYIHLDHGSSGGCIRGPQGQFIGIIRGIHYIEEQGAGAKVPRPLIQSNRCEFVPAQNVFDFLKRN